MGFLHKFWSHLWKHQVSLFNILQEGDVQIRGFKIRLPLDVNFVFTANPEDYTNRGSIVTPLKDRIGSQIITHYPNSIELAKEITNQEVAKQGQEDWQHTGGLNNPEPIETFKVCPFLIKRIFPQVELEFVSKWQRFQFLHNLSN